MGDQRDDKDQGVKAADDLDDLDDRDTDQLLADGEMVGSWSEDEDAQDTLLAGDERVGPWSEDDLEYGLRADADNARPSADEQGDADVDQLSDVPDPRSRRE